MARRTTIWCAHPTRHQNCTKVGYKVTHPKGKRVISKQVAQYIQMYYGRGVGKSKLTIQEGDFLCTGCYDYECKKMNQKYKPTEKKEGVVENHVEHEANELSYSSNISEEQPDNKDEVLSSSISSNASIKQLIYKQEVVELLNNVFELLNIERVVDIRHRDKLHANIDQVYVKLYDLCDNILNLESSSNSNNIKRFLSGVTLNDYQTLIDGLKQLFFISNKEQQIQLLTIAPLDWGRKKIEYFFNSTEHQSKEAIKLRYLYGLLARPTYFSGNKPLSTDIIDQVINFYEDDRISRQSSNKKDKIKVNGEDKIFRFMDMSIGDSYLVFKNEFTTILISHSKFYALRPKWVKINCHSQGCLCIYHENFQLLLEALNNRNKTKLNLQQIINSTLCTSHTEECYTKECEDCGDRLPSIIIKPTCKGDPDDEDNEIRWLNWIRILGKVSLQEISGNIATLLGNIDQQWSIILHHHYIKEQQKQYIAELKKKSNDKDYAVVNCDFAENYALVPQREVQAAHWFQQQIAIFTIHVKIGEFHMNIAGISDYLDHDTSFVHCCQKKIIAIIKDKFPLVKKIVYVSDGAAMHFKNKYNMYNLSCHKEEFGLEAEWVFTPTGHGRSVVDG
ncbi:unnamed protein product [Adineta steineri]|uniref:Uncharacterized protein n=1 Tax=Adineta steineri TaxID=433720 RepID=A0A820D0R9_9BILA|nr:unnamed protein product [Adineta steineri]